MTLGSVGELTPYSATDGSVLACKHLCWRKSFKTAVVVYMAVPLHVIAAPAHSVIIMIKAQRVVWMIL